MDGSTESQATGANVIPPKVESKRLEALSVVQRSGEIRLWRLFDWNRASIRIRNPASGTRSRVFFVSLDGRDAVTIRALRTPTHRTRFRRAFLLADNYNYILAERIRIEIRGTEMAMEVYVYDQ